MKLKPGEFPKGSRGGEFCHEMTNECFDCGEMAVEGVEHKCKSTWCAMPACMNPQAKGSIYCQPHLEKRAAAAERWAEKGGTARKGEIK